MSRAERRSPDCGAYIRQIFNKERSSQPEEVYYRLCEAVLASYHKYESHLVDLTCRQCLEYHVFSYKRFEAILKRNSITRPDDEPGLFAPVPTGHVNMRGNGYFK